MATTAALPLGVHGDSPTLRITCLDGKETYRASGRLIDRLVDERDDPLRDTTTAGVQLLEESEYRYEIEGTDAEIEVRLEPAELFSPDPPLHRTGRIKTGRSVGNVTVVVSAGGEKVGSCEFEVRSRKLDYLTDYRWMLEGISATVADVLLASFAPADVSLREQWTDEPQSIYPRFALLSSVLTGDEFDSAMASILHNPHHEYREIIEAVDPARGIKGGSRVAAALARPGPRVDGSTLGIPGVATLPREIDQVRHVETSDTIPNQFVKFALESWREVVDTVHEQLAGKTDSAARRGIAESEALLSVIDNVLTTPLMRSVGRLERFPSSNQVLQKRTGYRDVFRLFIQTEAAAALEWGPRDQVFPSGSKDVATLYEYWVYLELARIIESLGFTIDRRRLVTESDSGLVLNLYQGSKPVIEGSSEVLGRTVKVSLYYNRTFKRGSGTWTRTVRPDCSIRFTLSDALADANEVWVHFDAKYRIENIYQLFDAADDGDEAVRAPSPVPAQENVLTEDLMKMHAYRDAIERTAGSYVLFPGDAPDPKRSRFERYEEILPGIGGFALRPDSDGRASVDQSSLLAEFLHDIIDHLAARGTKLERSDYWLQHSINEDTAIVAPTDLLAEPPADTAVLIGYVKNDAHWEWLLATHQYNLRADGRRGAVDLASDMLRARFLLASDNLGSVPRLFRLGDAVTVRTADELLDSGYPAPGGSRYVCLTITEEPLVPISLSVDDVERIRLSVTPGVGAGAPVLATWSDVFAMGGQG